MDLGLPFFYKHKLVTLNSRTSRGAFMTPRPIFGKFYKFSIQQHGKSFLGVVRTPLFLLHADSTNF